MTQWVKLEDVESMLFSSAIHPNDYLWHVKSLPAISAPEGLADRLCRVDDVEMHFSPKKSGALIQEAADALRTMEG